MCFQHFRPLVYFFRHARSPATTYPGHVWLAVPPRKKLRLQSPVLHLEEDFSPQPAMTPHDAEPADIGISEEKAIHLALPELLPANHTLVVNPVKRILIMLYDEPGGEARRVKVQNISPSGIRVLIPLLKAADELQGKLRFLPEEDRPRRIPHRDTATGQPGDVGKRRDVEMWIGTAVRLRSRASVCFSAAIDYRSTSPSDARQKWKEPKSTLLMMSPFTLRKYRTSPRSPKWSLKYPIRPAPASKP